MAPKWKEWIDLAWNDWYEDRDTTENAVNYSAIFFVNTFLIADLTGRSQLMLDPPVRAMFERYRDQVSPSGVMPGYGDSSELASWPAWVAVFERCARDYRDPTFRWAARRVFEAGRRYVPPRRSYHGSLTTFYMTYVENWKDISIGGREPRGGADLLTRREPRDSEAPDKIVLSPSRTAGAPFAFVELYANRATHAKPEFGGGHTHPEHGSAEYYEVDGTMLLHSLGYNNRSPAHANIVMIRPPGQEFPLKTKPHTPNVWNHASLPTAAMAPFEEDRNQCSFDSIVLRVPTGPVDFTVDDLHLSGPKGELLVVEPQALAGPAQIDELPLTVGTRADRHTFVLDATQNGLAPWALHIADSRSDLVGQHGLLRSYYSGTSADAFPGHPVRTAGIPRLQRSRLTGSGWPGIMGGDQSPRQSTPPPTTSSDCHEVVSAALRRVRGSLQRRQCLARVWACLCGVADRR